MGAPGLSQVTKGKADVRQDAIELERERMRQEYEIRLHYDKEKRKAAVMFARKENTRLDFEYDQKMRELEEDQKREEQTLREKIKREKKEAKEKEEREYIEYLLKQNQERVYREKNEERRGGTSAE